MFGLFDNVFHNPNENRYGISNLTLKILDSCVMTSVPLSDLIFTKKKLKVVDLF